MLTADELLRSNTPFEAIERNVRAAVRKRAPLMLALCLGLHRLFRANFHRKRKFATFADYVVAELGLADWEAWKLHELGAKLLDLPLTRRAMETGELTYTKVREYASLATPEDEGEWVEYARTHSNRALEGRVARIRNQKEGKTKKKKVVSHLNGVEQQKVQRARDKIMKQKGRSVREEELLSLFADEVLKGNTGKKGTEVAATIMLCPQCLEAFTPVPGRYQPERVQLWVDTIRQGAGLYDFMPEFFCDCRDATHVRDRCPHYAPRTAPAPETRDIPTEKRRRVRARDGVRCCFPGCSMPVGHDFSHLDGFANGGPHEVWNLRRHCKRHNEDLRLGEYTVRGQAPLERYYDRDGNFIGTGHNPERVSHVGNRPGEPRPPEERPPPGEAGGAAAD